MCNSTWSGCCPVSAPAGSWTVERSEGPPPDDCCPIGAQPVSGTFPQTRLVPCPRCSRHCGTDGGIAGWTACDGTWRRRCDWCCCVGGSVCGGVEEDSSGQKWSGCRTGPRPPRIWGEIHRRIKNLRQIPIRSPSNINSFRYFYGPGVHHMFPSG